MGDEEVRVEMGVERFFNGPAQAQAQGSNSDLITLLSGPPSCGKTSLLFQFAFNIVAQSQFDSGYVVFICNRRRFHSNPPYLSQGIHGSSHVFDRIHIKYIDDYDDQALKNYFAAFHLLDPFPLAVIIDDFAHFFSQSMCQQRYNSPRARDLAMVRVLALCHNAITHANKASTCQLLLSDTSHGDSPRLLFIYKRWISSIFSIRAEGSGSFTLKHKHSVTAAAGDTRKKSARYSIALQYLVLEGIIEDD